MDLKEICVSLRNLVDSTADRDYWRALVNVALNLRVPYSIHRLVSYIFLLTILFRDCTFPKKGDQYREILHMYNK